jgi:hypothetical protein
LVPSDRISSTLASDSMMPVNIIQISSFKTL